jgi:von Willebrand factor type A domain
MANMIDITSNTLSQNTICFETNFINSELVPNPLENAKFGILNFQAVTASESNKQHDFLFIVDCSGSMSDRCSDRRNKMQHIIHTLKNMIIFLYENTKVNFHITIHAFDTKIYKIVPRTKINDGNLSNILKIIDKIYPRGSTNIENALMNSLEEIKYLQLKYPDNVISHIFMTDGEATYGSTDAEILKKSVAEDVMNAFIGFGIDHDIALLNELGSVGKSSYYFIDKLENSGLVYGEILHSIIYKLVTDSEITIENGLIYDFKKNIWTSSLHIGDIISEANKTFNIISTDPELVKVDIKGSIDNMIVLHPSHIGAESDLSKHIFRQRTLQLMFQVNDYCIKKRKWSYNRNNRNIDVFDFINTDNIEDEETIEGIDNYFKKESTSLKLKLRDFIAEMKKFMLENNLSDDKFMKNLCDDIYICFRTFDTIYGNMFCTARQTSQGNQRQYTVSNTLQFEANDHYLHDGISINIPINSPINIPINSPNHLQGEGCNIVTIDNNNNNNNNSPPDLFHIDHHLSDFADTPYLTPQATQVMNFISTLDIDYEDDNHLSASTQKY